MMEAHNLSPAAGQGRKTGWKSDQISPAATALGVVVVFSGKHIVNDCHPSSVMDTKIKIDREGSERYEYGYRRS